MKIRLGYLWISILLLVVEIAIGLWINDDFIRPYLGDFLVTILIYAMVMTIIQWNWRKSLILTMIFCYAVEIAQYFQVVNLLQLEKHQLARVIIGMHFSWIDLLCYTLAGIVIYTVEIFRVTNSTGK